MSVDVMIKDNGRRLDIKIVMCAIICLTLIEIVALLKGINGQLLRWMTIIIAGLAGILIPTPNIKNTLKRWIE